ncbi:MAG: sensor domain-containing protein [Steroidobacteraceae bacterium]|jgi:uncharacterized membrane protein|nr:sensor domain-containing protein [Steroidobacteraceae bacterium]
MIRPAPRSIDQYLEQLREALRGEDPALVQDALYDAEEYLRAELATHAGRSEADVLELIASTYGAPDEVADAYRTTEATVRAALAPPAPPTRRTPFGRFFGVYADSRAWTALFYMVLALVTGIFYFTVTVTGLSMSAGLAILIVGVPFFLMFVGFTRLLSLVEGRLVEALLGVRMPRRPVRRTADAGVLERIKEMLVDRRTWTTMLYLLLMLPLGVAYFVGAVVGLSLGFGFVVGGLVLILQAVGVDVGQNVGIDGEPISALWAPLMLVGGVVLTTLLMHAAKWIGQGHGWFAKTLLVAPAREATA